VTERADRQWRIVHVMGWELCEPSDVAAFKVLCVGCIHTPL
jgi:hypothetical protein